MCGSQIHAVTFIPYFGATDFAVSLKKLTMKSPNMALTITWKTSKARWFTLTVYSIIIDVVGHIRWNGNNIVSCYGAFHKFWQKIWAEIAKYAMEHDVAPTVNHLCVSLLTVFILGY